MVHPDEALQLLISNNTSEGDAALVKKARNMYGYAVWEPKGLGHCLVSLAFCWPGKIHQWQSILASCAGPGLNTVSGYKQSNV